MTAKSRNPLAKGETAATEPAPPLVERQQVGARIPVSKYRQLKARAALDGIKVQALVEEAIDQFLAAKP
jgi:hypothetical protein